MKKTPAQVMHLAHQQRTATERTAREWAAANLKPGTDYRVKFYATFWAVYVETRGKDGRYYVTKRFDVRA